MSQDIIKITAVGTRYRASCKHLIIIIINENQTTKKHLMYCD